MTPDPPIPSLAPIPRRVLSEIGRIILQGATIEHLVSICLIQSLRMSVFRGLIAVRGMSLANKLSRLQYIVEAEKDTKFVEEYDEISKLMDRFLSCRNSIAHASYSFQNTFKHKEADYHFSDLSDLGTEADQFSTKLAIFSHSDFKMCSRTGATICYRLSELFEVVPLHAVSQGTIREKKPPTPRSLRKSRDKATQCT